MEKSCQNLKNLRQKALVLRKAEMRMEKPDWASIKTEFIKCSLSQREFAKAKGVSAPALMGRAAREKWEQERGKLQAIVSSKAIESVRNGSRPWPVCVRYLYGQF